MNNEGGGCSEKGISRKDRMYRARNKQNSLYMNETVKE